MTEREKVEVWIYARKKGEGPEARSSATPAIQVLLLKMRPDRGGFWQPVTGSVEPGEALASAALREAQEETGLEFAGPPQPLCYSFTFEGTGERRGLRFREHGFALEVPGATEPVKLDPHEHVEYQWLSAQETFKLLHFSSNADMLRILIRNLSKER